MIPKYKIGDKHIGLVGDWNGVQTYENEIIGIFRDKDGSFIYFTDLSRGSACPNKDCDDEFCETQIIYRTVMIHENQVKLTRTEKEIEKFRKRVDRFR